MDPIFQQIFNYTDTPSIVFGIDEPEFTIKNANEAFLKIALAPKELIVGKTLFEAFPAMEDQEQGAEDMLVALRHSLHKKEPFKLTVLKYDVKNHYTGEKEEKYWEITSQPILDRNGEVLYILVKTYDITESISDLLAPKFQTALSAEMDFKFKNIFELSSVAIALINLDGVLVEVNPKMTDYLGYGRYEYLNQKYEKFIHPADIDSFGYGLGQLNIDRKSVFNTEIRFYHRNGKTVWFYASVTLIKDKKDRPLHYVVHFIDITDRKEVELALLESEQRYQSLFHHNPDPVFAFSLDGKFISANDATCRLTQLTWDQLLGNLFLPFIPLDDKRRVFDNFLKASEGKSLSYNTGFLSSKGELKTLNITNMPIISHGKIVGVYGIAKDITDKLNAEITLLKAKDQYEQLISTIDGMVWESDENLKTLYVSPQTKEILGFSPDEWYNHENFWFEHVLQEDRNALWVAFLEGMETGKNFTFESRMIAADGRTVWLRNNVSIIKRKGRATVLRGVMTDITKAKDAQHALEANEAKLKKILNQSLDVICTISPEGNFIDVSEASLKVWGYKPEELCGTPYADYVYGEDQLKTSVAASEILSGVDLTNFENRYIHKDGHLVDTAWSVHFDFAEKIMFCVAKDITERKKYEAAINQSNQRYELVTQATSDAVWDWNIETGQVFRGSGFLKIFGHNPFLLPQNVKAWDNLNHPKDRERIAESIKRFIDSQELHWEEEYRYRKADGDYAYVQDRAIAVRDNSGKALRIVGALSDITQEKFLEKEDKLRIDLGAVFRKENSPGKGLRKSLDIILEFTELTYGEVWFKPSDKEGLVLSSFGGNVIQSPRDFPLNFSKGEGIHGKAWETGEKLFFTDLQNCEEFVRKDFAIANKLESAVVFPICCNGETIAVFALYAQDKNTIIRSTSQISLSICEQLATDYVCKKSENDLNAFFDISGDMLFIVGMDGAFKKVNKAAQQTLGYSESEMFNAYFVDWVHDEDKEETVQVFSRMEEPGHVMKNENRLRTKSGKYRWIAWTSTSLVDEGVFISVGRDITERKDYEEKLKASKDEVTKTLESIQDAFFALDKSFKVTYWNREAERLLGVKREEVLGKVLWDSFPEAVSLAFFDKYNKVMSEKVSLNFEEFFPPVNTWFEVTAYPSEDGITVYFKNINERKQLELELMQFKNVIENSKEGIGILNFEQNTHYRNPALLAKLGQPDDRFKGVERPAQYFTDPKKAKEVFDTLTNGKYYDGIITLTTQSGEHEDFHLSAGPIFDEKDKVIAVFGIHSEIKKEDQVLQ
ncbi:PAS domain S-box protein [Litoribacter ruber]|uniref:PAS domain S-box protein n=1 Tax=Litoribacter ruber TaxID=702568 RepID=UPI001BDB014D|nr:PAS domain S-box protein [Litoribacter ruber]MBT0810298.1 PAS domain S-box protein [Litoribacter ruber]